MILTRVNTITGVAYKDDPTIFALELANEPHTTDDYETIRGLPPGVLVKAWMEVIVKTIRVVDTKHMVRSLACPQCLLHNSSLSSVHAASESLINIPGSRNWHCKR